ncbi:hypothetical protein ACG02S_21795 [Roseateles sp. DC23W]|uniref:PEP-CTERM protein-sorting domain-containing protein n=1 Tax=Pelomonas dachongensis TaxID=3299029 RepID=A0ABW7ESS3_9BURK
MKPFARFAAGFSLIASAAGAWAVPVPTYSVTQLKAVADPTAVPAPPSAWSPISFHAGAMNGAGQVVGYTRDLRGPSTAATLWQNGDATNLGRFSNITGDPYSQAQAVAINDAGDIVVNVLSTSGYEVVVLRNGAATVFDGVASAINNQGVVAGHSSTWRATIWSGSQVIELGTAGGSQSSVAALSDTGIAVGVSGIQGDPTYQCMEWPGAARCVVGHAMVWSASGVATDLGVLDGLASHATGVNDLGQVVGAIHYGEGRPSGSFLWDGTSMTDMGVANLVDINNHGVIVGSTRSSNGRSRASVWFDGVEHDLTSLVEDDQFGWVLSSSLDINDAGQILASGLDNVGGWAVFVLTPMGVANELPEPAPLALLSAGLLALMGQRGGARKAFSWTLARHTSAPSMK